jgi:hypothetical protein
MSCPKTGLHKRSGAQLQKAEKSQFGTVIVSGQPYLNSLGFSKDNCYSIRHQAFFP